MEREKRIEKENASKTDMEECKKETLRKNCYPN